MTDIKLKMAITISVSNDNEKWYYLSQVVAAQATDYRSLWAIVNPKLELMTSKHPELYFRAEPTVIADYSSLFL